MEKCSRCDFLVDDKNNFCSNCGMKLKNRNRIGVKLLKIVSFLFLVFFIYIFYFEYSAREQEKLVKEYEAALIFINDDGDLAKGKEELQKITNNKHFRKLEETLIKENKINIIQDIKVIEKLEKIENAILNDNKDLEILYNNFKEKHITDYENIKKYGNKLLDDIKQYIDYRSELRILEEDRHSINYARGLERLVSVDFNTKKIKDKVESLTTKFKYKINDLLKKENLKIIEIQDFQWLPKINGVEIKETYLDIRLNKNSLSREIIEKELGGSVNNFKNEEINKAIEKHNKKNYKVKIL